MRLEGKRVLVTGVGSGIGRGIALKFAAEGASLVGADINLATAERTCQEIGDAAMALEVDVADRRSTEDVTRAAVEHLGGLDVLVNVAGIQIIGAVHELAEEDWDREIDVNLKSVYLMSKAAWPALAKHGGGSIISIASDAGIGGLPQDAAYCASKAGVVMLTKCMAIDGGPSRIRANCICPGYIHTPLLDGYFNDQADPAAATADAVGLTPLGRLGEVEDVAGGAAFLASDESSFVSGTSLVVDGGYLAGLFQPEAEAES